MASTNESTTLSGVTAPFALIKPSAAGDKVRLASAEQSCPALRDES